MKPSERAAWRESVRAIESYRERWGVTDPDSALGKNPVPRPQSAERDRVQRRLDQGHDKSVERDVEVLERSLEL